MKYNDCPLTEVHSLDAFIEIPDNPRQRDTAVRAGKAVKKHLSHLHPSHTVVSIARLPNGEEYKLDGHTRCYLWDSEELERPSHVTYLVYELETVEQVKDFYRAFDSSSAAETSNDKVYSSLRDAFGYQPSSELFKNRGARTAIELVVNKGGSISDDHLYELSQRHPDAVEAMKIIDRENTFSKGKFNASFLGTMILTVMKDGEDALKFWEMFENNEGTKNAGKSDAVEIMCSYYYDINRFKNVQVDSQRPSDVRTGTGRDIHAFYVPRLLAIYAGWTRNQTYTPKLHNQGWSVRRLTPIEADKFMAA
ncbi:MAG: hypothetical protein QNK36_21100 [Colwellia sp.]|nr:hypothetical protein [Colwellia sp.]